MAISSNWGTAKALMKMRLGRERSVDDEIVGAEIAYAINYYRSYDLWFLRKVESFALVANQESYAVGASPGPGTDVIRITGARIIDANDSTNFYDIEEVGQEQFRAHQYTHTVADVPEVFMWEYDATDDSTFTIAFSAVPDDTHSFEYDYIADIGTPGVKLSGTSIIITDPDDRTAEIGDSYSNFWFTRAEDLILNRALSQYYRNYVANSELADQYEREEYKSLQRLRGQADIQSFNRISSYYN